MVKNKNIKVRVTQEQYDTWTSESASMDMNISEYIREMLAHVSRNNIQSDYMVNRKRLKVFRQNVKVLSKFLNSQHNDLKRIGNNINQITKHVNEKPYHTVLEGSQREILKELDGFENSLDDLTHEIRRLIQLMEEV